jgi:transposase-like protein
VLRPAFPTGLQQFQRQFADEAACREYLEACRWPDGFRCPRCGHGRAFPLRAWRRRECAKCRYQVSLTAGTVFHRTRTPLTLWFWAAYLMTTDKRGISALLLQRQLAIRRYETAWLILHKLRRAMVNAAREPLHGEVEIDDTWIGGPQPGLRGSRQLKGRKAAIVLVAVEKRAEISGRVRMAVVPDFKQTTVVAFVKQHVAPGSTVYTDGLKGFGNLQPAGVRHVPRTQPLRSALRRGIPSVVPLADRAIGNLQQWLIGTYHGVGRHHLQVYLDEFVFRHNRRKTPMAAFQTLLGLGTGRGPTPGSLIRGGRDLPQFPITS